MRVVDKVGIVAALALLALGSSVSSASADVFVADEDFGHECPSIRVIEHVVFGGCHFEIQSENHIPMIVFTPGGPVTLSNCNMHLEGQIGPSAQGYITGVTLDTEQYPTTPPCTRTACDESANSEGNPHAELPWPFFFQEYSGFLHFEMTLCLRAIASGEGGTGVICELHLPWNTGAGHSFELGNSATSTCEGVMGAVSFGNVHFVEEVQNAEPEEDIEIIH